MSGRNDPCPCGSNIKYKKCCLLKLNEAEAEEQRKWNDWFQKDCSEGEKNLKEYEAILD